MKSDAFFFGYYPNTKEQFQLHYIGERFMSEKHSSLPWARIFGIINKNAVTAYFLARILCNTIGLAQLTEEKSSLV